MTRTLRLIMEKRFAGQGPVKPYVRYNEDNEHPDIIPTTYEGIVGESITVMGEDREEVRDITQFLSIMIEAAKQDKITSAFLNQTIGEPPEVINEPVEDEDEPAPEPLSELPEDLEIGQVVWVNPCAVETTVTRLQTMNYYGDGQQCLRTEVGWVRPGDLFLDHAAAVAADEERIAAELAAEEEEC